MNMEYFILFYVILNFNLIKYIDYGYGTIMANQIMDISVSTITQIIMGNLFYLIWFES